MDNHEHSKTGRENKYVLVQLVKFIFNQYHFSEIYLLTVLVRNFIYFFSFLFLFLFFSFSRFLPVVFNINPNNATLFLNTGTVIYVQNIISFVSLRSK